jgi:aminopeptidase N
MGRLRLALLPLAFLLLPAALSAQRLPSTATPEHYDLAFDVDIAQKRFDGTESIRVQLAEPSRRIVLNAAEITFTRVIVESGGSAQDAVVALDAQAQTATLTVATPLPAGPADIRVTYTGVLNDMLRGLYLAKSAKRNYAISQFESTDARRAFPSFDEPAYKATFTVAVTVDRGDTAISNGRVVSDTPGPGPDRHTIRFTESPKMSPYLVALAIGDFQCLEGSADDVPIRVCAVPDKVALGALALEYAQQMLTYYDQYFTIKYPFGKLDMIAVPDFAAGGMENTAAIFYQESDLLADESTASVAVRKGIAATVAHEMSHQWFGDLVTMRWWDDLWLNEGFATWMETRPLASSMPEWNLAVDEAAANQTALNVDSLRSTHPIHAPLQTPAEIDASFDAISYQKGAAVLRMIEHYVGAEAFRDGVNAYLAAHAYGNATSEDFWTMLTATSGKPIDRILPTFIDQPGVPLLDLTALTCSGGGTRASFAQERLRLDPALPTGSAIWQIPVCMKVGKGSSPPACQLLSQPRQTLDAGNGCAPWVFVNAGALGYYRTGYTPDEIRAIAPQVEDALTAPERLALVDDEWALVRAGQHGAGGYLTLASAFGRETSSGVLGEIADRLAFMHQYLTTGATRERFEAFTRTMLAPLFRELGFSAAPNDTADRRQLRAVVIGALGTTGNDPAVVRRARLALERILQATSGGGEGSVDPTSSESVVRIAAEHGDAALYDALVAAASRAKSPAERNLYFYAAADFGDPGVIDRALRRTLTSDVRTQDTARYLAGFFANPIARPRAWMFVKANWTLLEPRLKVFNASNVLAGAVSSFCDAAARDDVKAFFDAHRLGGMAGPLGRSIERINNCIDLREKQTKAVGEWLAMR